MGAPMVKASVSYNEAFAARVTSRLKEKGRGVKQSRVTVGISEEDATTAKTDYYGRATGASVVEVALAHEFGTDTLPERSWFRSWFDQNANRLKLEMIPAKRAEFGGDSTAVEKLAVKWALELRRWISDGQAGLEALTLDTVRARGRAGLAAGPPLFATGQLVNAIRAFVDGEDVGP